MRDFHLSWGVVVGSSVVLVVFCGAYSVSYPQLPPEGSTGVLWLLTGTCPCEAPNQGRMMGTSERQLLCAWLVLACGTAYVDTVVGGRTLE